MAEQTKSTFDLMLSKNKIAEKKLKMPEFGGLTLIVKGLSGEGVNAWLDEVEQWDAKKTKKNPSTFLLLCRTVFDEAGKPVFERERIEEFEKLYSVPVLRIAQVATKLSGLDKSDVDLSDLEGN